MSDINLVSRNYQSTQVSDKNESIMYRWIARLADGGAKVPKEHAKVALQAMAEWDSPTVKGRPSIITPFPGFGKSYLLEEFLWHKMRDQDVTTGRRNIRTDFGAIIVKSKREEVKALVDTLNRGERIPGYPDKLRDKDKFAYGLYGYDETAADGMTPTYEAYRMQKTVQQDFNIIVMTAEKLKNLTLQGDLDSYRSFVNTAEDRCDRSLLIIDEKPVVVENHRIDPRDLNEVIEWANSHRGQYYKDLAFQVIKLRNVLESPDIKDKELTIPDKEGRKFTLDKRIAYKLGNENNFESLTKLKAIQHILRQGGRVTKYEDKEKLVSYISCAIKVHYDWTQLNASILDATGHLAKEYVLINESMTHIRTDVAPQYENLQYYISEEHNLTKSSLKNEKFTDVITKMHNYCKEIQGRHPDVKFLVITYKKYEEALAKKIGDNVLLMTKYFDGGRGTNKYIECDGVIFLGNFFKTEDYYVNMASVINGRLLDDGVTPRKSGNTFKDGDVETFKLADSLESFIQELSRTRPVRKDQNIPVYMFTKDKEFINHIKGECPGAKFSSYSATFKIIGKESTKHEIAKLISNMKPGEKVKKSEWYKSKGIPVSTFADAMKTQTVTDTLIFNDVRAKGHYLVKEEG